MFIRLFINTLEYIRSNGEQQHPTYRFPPCSFSTQAVEMESRNKPLYRKLVADKIDINRLHEVRTVCPRSNSPILQYIIIEWVNTFWTDSIHDPEAICTSQIEYAYNT